MKNIFFASVVLALSFGLSRANACEPCTYQLSLEDTIEQADLVIIGTKYGVGPLSGPENRPDIYGPDWISVEVGHVLKGTESKEKIKVNSWTGMCKYGIVLEDDQPYMIFLEKGDLMYDSVDWGCSLKALPLIEGGVIVNGERFTVAELFPESIQDPQPSPERTGVTVRKNGEPEMVKMLLDIFIFSLILTALAVASLVLNVRIRKNKKKHERRTQKKL